MITILLIRHNGFHYYFVAKETRYEIQRVKDLKAEAVVWSQDHNEPESYFDMELLQDLTMKIKNGEIK